MSETIGKISSKRYACAECGHVVEQSTNHYGQTYSWGRVNVCPNCPPWKRPNTWNCLEPLPEGMERPENWTKTTITIKKQK